MKEGLLSQIENLCKPILARAGFALLEVEVHPGKEPRVIFIIYKPEGVSIADCERVTGILSEHVDQFFAGRYHLEVSSPGLDRELKRREEFDLFKGREVRILLKRPIEGEDTVEGILEGLEGENVRLRSGAKAFAFPLEVVQKARLIFK
ncbi:MAG: ribosome maturation factor RimP [Coprothermobacterota bacterium]|jgi:ribosome maturation factor RimP|nr:ribosome maturation factor RimP [Caldisericota bacterium]MDI6868471.1 ribosome maturation factor RimP [Coprothermobacterota bacterium]